MKQGYELTFSADAEVTRRDEPDESYPQGDASASPVSPVHSSRPSREGG